MPLDAFHPLVARWFEETLGEPTAAQHKGWPAIRAGRHTLIAAPTGSGKTLAAFLTVLDDLFREGLEQPLPEEVRVVYVSPLKALSADVHKNLAEPRRGVRRIAAECGLEAPRISAAVRTGDTTQSERAAMLRHPPHILVTTPESLYLLLTADRSRQMLRTARTIIVDEIHAVIGTRRGAHLALSLERLDEVAERPLVRIGLSATQKPVQEVARYLVGDRPIARDVVIVDEGHRRLIDLDLEMPSAPLETVMSHELWEDYYDRLAALIREHRTTLIFVNTRRLAERLARHLTDRLGEDAVTAHHGSLSKERRLAAESRLKAGTLKALVATASLELGIDIGSVDLVCQIGSPHRIATLLQRIGRSGHSLASTPKGRIFPASRDDLIECAALLRCVRRGELDAIVNHDAPLDVLAQQIVAETSCREYSEDELFALVRRAWPYRALGRRDFDAVVAMTADGFATKRGRRSALVHRDEVNHVVRGRRGARLLSISSGGAIPEVADYRVLLDPDETFVGTLNEDFAIESMAGDIFQLGNTSWRILQVGRGVVRVADAHGQPPTIPFWFGEAPARSDELSRAVSDLRAHVQSALDSNEEPRPAEEWLEVESGISRTASSQAIEYLANVRRALGIVPTQDAIVLERFFDESGGMQLVLHAPFGSRVTRAWGLALRKRFCRQFNFELQAAATEDALLLSLGPQHSFPLADVFRYLHSATARDVLVQAFLDAPVFQTRWRWNTTISLAVPRNRGGRKVPPQLQRMLADDLMAAVFPDAAACLENIPGDRQIPDHPLVNQTVRDCLEEAMDVAGLSAILDRIHRGDIRCIARDTPEPSPLAHDILNARPYAFLDDAPLEERRTQAVYTRRATEPTAAAEVGALDEAAIVRVRDEARVDARDADELHDALVSFGFLTPLDVQDVPHLFDELVGRRRAATMWIADGVAVKVAAERLPEMRAVYPAARWEPAIDPPASRAARSWTRESALVELLRGRMMLPGPITARALAGAFAADVRDIDGALLALESEGVVLRGYFTPPSARTSDELEWCDRRLLARVHRYTLNRLRAEIEPVSPADFMRFLFAWQHVDSSSRLSAIDGLRAAVATLDGFEAAAHAWERAILPARVDGFDASMLDLLCLSGEVGWGRIGSIADASPARLVGATPIALFLREHGDAWHVLRFNASGERTDAERSLSEPAQRVLASLRERGASFLHELASRCALSSADLEVAVGELAAVGFAASDGFAGLRALVRSTSDRALSRTRQTPPSGRWSAIAVDDSPPARDAAVETQAWTFLRRYGVVFRRLLAREANAAAWRDLTRVYRRLEARGEIRGGRFVSGMSGEQFALPDGVERLREIRRTTANGRIVAISAADPLNLAGIVTSGERVRALPATRIAYRDGIPLAVLEGDYIRPLGAIDSAAGAELATVLTGRRLPAVAAGYVGRG